MMTMSNFNARSFKLCCIIAATACAFFLQACSAVKLGYNQAPDIAYWWLDSYIDFNGQQTPKVRDELTRLFAWHRSTELPKYTALLQKTQAQMPRDVSAEQVCAVYGEARALYNNITEKIQPAVVDLSSSLGVEQIDHLARQYAKKNEEYQRDYLKGSAGDRAAKRLKQAVERSETVYGKLEEPQIAAIKKAIASSSFDAAVWLKERMRRQQDALQIMRKIVAERPDSPAVQSLLRGYLSRSLVSPDPVYRAYAEKMTQESCMSFSDVHATTSAAQRVKAAQTLQGYAADFSALAAQK